MTTPARPTIVLVPGSYSPITFHTEFKYRLLNAGFDVYMDDLPSASGAPSLPPADLASDATCFRNIISNLVDQGKSVSILAHSYGGLVARETVTGAKLSEEYRRSQGQQGGINRIIYISPMFTTPPDTCMQFFPKYADKLPWLTENITDAVDLETEGGPQYLRQNPIKAAPFFFNDLPETEAIKWTVRMSMQTMASWLSETHELDQDTKKIPVSFIKCLKDAVFPVAFQNEMIGTLAKERESVGLEGMVDVREIDSAHFPSVSCPDELVGLVRDIVLQGGK